MRKPVFLVVLAIAFSLVQAPVALAATARWVNGVGVPVPPGASCALPGYSTIQAAIAASAAGDTINVCPGHLRRKCHGQQGEPEGRFHRRRRGHDDHTADQ